MDIKTRKEKNVLVVDLMGRLDALSSPDFDKLFKGLADQGESLFLVNLSGLAYISSAGLRSLLAGANLMKTKGGKFMLAGLQGVVKETFEITHLHSVLEIHDSTEIALSRTQ